jgi:Fe-S-cluster containining protein
MNHCSEKCLGFKDNHGGCCQLDDRDFIIGPVLDANDFLQRVKSKFNGVPVEWKDVFIDYEEGSKMFPERSNYQNPAHYPALRVDNNHVRKPCIFYNSTLKCCGVYEIRPNMCKEFFCPYLKNIKEDIVNLQ